MSHLKSSHSVSLPIAKESFLSEQNRHASRPRRNRKTIFSLRGDESPKVELPPLPRWMLNTPINSKFPMIPAPKGKIVLFTTDLCKTLHPAPRNLEFDPTGQGVSSEYQSLHDPHLKNHYWQGDSFTRLVRGGFVTSDGKVKCSLKEFNDFQHYLKRVRLEKMDQDHKRLLQIERDEKELRRYESVKTVDQLAHAKRIEDAQKRWKKREKERQKRLKQQLDAYDAKHACIVTDQFLRHQIDEVRRELEEQKRLNHKLQVEKEEHEKKITYLRKRAREEKRRANMLEERQVSSREKQQKVLEEKWERKLVAKDSRFAREYLKKLRSDSKLNDGVSNRKRKLELSWLKQEADYARISEIRMKKMADEEAKIAMSLERKLGIIRKRFERKLKKLQVMLRSGGIPPVVQLQRTHRFAERRTDWEIQQEEMKIQEELEREREMEYELEMKRQRKLERQKAKELARARALAASAPPPITCIELLDKSSINLPAVEESIHHASWSEAMTRTGLSVEILPPIKSTPSGEGGGEDVEPSEHILEAVEVHIEGPSSDESIPEVYIDEKAVCQHSQEYENQMHTYLARDVVTDTLQAATAQRVVDASVKEALIQNAVIASIEKGLASSVVQKAVDRAVSVASETHESEKIPSVVVSELLPGECVEEICPVESIKSMKAMESMKEVTATESVKDVGTVESEVAVKVTPSKVAAKYLATTAIGKACHELHRASSRSPDYRATTRWPPFRKTPSDMARQLADEALEGMTGDLKSEGKHVDSTRRKTPSNIGRGLASDAVQDAVYEVSVEEHELRQTPSNVGRHLATSVMKGAVDELDEMVEAKLCLTFADKTSGMTETGVASPKPASSMDIPKGITSPKLTSIIDIPKGVTSPKPASSMDIPKGIAGPKPVSSMDFSKVPSRKIEVITKHETLPDGPETRTIVSPDIAKLALSDAMFKLQHIPEPTTSVLMSRDLAKLALGEALADLLDMPQYTPSVAGQDLAKVAVEDALTELQDVADNYLGIDRVFATTPSQLARDLADSVIEDAAEDIAKTDGTEVETRLRKTPSNVARTLAKGAVARAKDDLQESTKLYNARKRSFYKSRSEIEIIPVPVGKTKKTQSELVRKLSKGTAGSAIKVFKEKPKATRKTPSDEIEIIPEPVGMTTKTQSELVRKLSKGTAGSTIKVLEKKQKATRKPPSDVTRDLAQGAISKVTRDPETDPLMRIIYREVTRDLETDPVMRVIYRKTPSNLARFLAKDAMEDTKDDLEEDDEQVVTLLRNTPSNEARNLAKGAVLAASREIQDQVRAYRTPSPVRTTPSDMGRGVAKGVLLDAVGELNQEGKDVDGVQRSTPSNIARHLTKKAVTGAAEDLDRQSPIYDLPKKCRKTPSDVARAVTGDMMTEAIGEIEEAGHQVDGTSRKTPSNLARTIAGSVIADAETEMEQASGGRTYAVRGKTSSNIARQVAADALTDGIDDIESEGKSIEGILRKTPSNLGRGLARDAVGEALGELDSKATQSHHLTGRDPTDPAPSLVTAQDLAAVAIEGASTELQGVESLGSSAGDDLEFDEEDLKEIWGNTSAVTSVLLASVMDVFSAPSVAVPTYVEDDDEEDDDEGDEEVIGVLENALIADDEPVLTKSDSSLTDIVHVSDDGKLIVEGAVKISSSDGPITTRSVTEAALSMESLKKNASGQLIRESSSESSTGEPTISKHPSEEERKGPQYFRVVPLYQNKTIDIGDEIIKDNLSAISIKPDVKKGIAEAHKPHSRNSFRNIFRPDMTHCEGSAKSLKDTLIAQLSQQSSSEMSKKTLDECCKVLDEEQPDITARHSDEELVTIGEVEGVCMWPKAKGFKAHVIDSPVPEAEVEEETSQTGMTKETADVDTKTDKESSTDKPTAKKSGSLVSTVVSKISDVFRKRSGETDSSQHQKIDQPNKEDEVKTVSEQSSRTGTQKCEKSADHSGETVTEVSDACAQVLPTKAEIEHVDDVKKADNGNDRKDPQEGSTQELVQTTVEPTPAKSNTESKSTEDKKDDNDNHDDINAQASVDPVVNTHNDTKEPETTTKSSSIKKSLKEADENKVTKSSSRRTVSTTSSKKSLAIRKSSSASRKKSNVSIIYVKPADPKLSRSSCTVLRAGKSISRASSGSQSTQRVRTPSKEPSRRSSSRDAKSSRSSGRSVHKTAGAKSDGNYLTAGKTGSEETGLRPFKSVSTSRKLSQQAIPTSSHRALEMATKLSHSASELEGTRSGDVAKSDYSDDMNSDAMWPVSRAASSSRPSSSQGGSECPGVRTPPEEPLSDSHAAVAKLSPKACPEQMGFTPHQTSKKEVSSCHQTETIQEETEPLQRDNGEEPIASGDKVEHHSEATSPVPQDQSDDHRDSHHHHPHGRRPSMIESLIHRVFSHSSTSSSHHHHHDHDDHPGRRHSIIEVILERVHSITHHHRRSNQVLPIVDHDDVDSNDQANGSKEEHGNDEATTSKQDH